MAKKQTRRSISVSRTTYEKLKAFCETEQHLDEPVRGDACRGLFG